MLRQKTYRNSYTLFEIAIVIALMALFTTIVVVKMRNQSASTLDSISLSLQKLFSSALFMAQAEDSVVIIEYSKNDRTFIFSSTNINKNYLSEFSIHIPENIEIEFLAPELSDFIYKFYPDGTASGPEFKLKMKEKMIFFSVSSLTGMLIAKKEEI
ncbi:MAG TPA: hypothetical protein P5105_04180 [Victivallales bacterium]|nr:hypothetical protein [Victivallales bacterium]HRR06460.1 hypothetical protein [Victivallales bacterium]HRR28941.1 hypothetical protein [Victivallales bacterium]HRU00356.1 hypothetical protein [Victivallales bacterium]